MRAVGGKPPEVWAEKISEAFEAGVKPRQASLLMVKRHRCSSVDPPSAETAQLLTSLYSIPATGYLLHGSSKPRQKNCRFHYPLGSTGLIEQLGLLKNLAMVAKP